MSTLRVLPTLLLSCLAATALTAPGAQAVDGTPARGAWTLEQGTAEPSYAAADTVRTNLNVETVVLACEAGGKSRLLQIQLYMSDEGPLQPTYRHEAAMKDDPQAVVAIDGQDFPVSLLFSDDHVVLADDQDGPWPKLSPRLADAMQAGKVMTVKLDLLDDAAGAPKMDGEAVVNLQAPGCAQAIAAVRKCAEAGTGPAHVAEARH